EALAPRHTALHRSFVESKERRIVFVEADDGKIVGKIDRQQPQPATCSVGGGIFEPVSVRLERDLRNHVIIGDCEPVRTDGKARAGRRLLSGADDERANLQQPRRDRGENAFRGGTPTGASMGAAPAAPPPTKAASSNPDPIARKIVWTESFKNHS